MSYVSANPLRWLRRKWNGFRHLQTVLGWVAALAYLAGAPIIWPKAAAHRLFMRKGTSDRDVFKQIFVDQEYERLNLDDGLIIDCGAYVGYSAAYFLTRYPRCTVFAIEPDRGNFSQLAKNLQLYGKRAMLFNAGVWSHATRLAICSDIYRDGREWTRQVYEDPRGLVEGMEIGALLASSGYRRISLLKMDVEGCEVVIFSQKPAWLSQVDNIAIELHDDSMFGSATNAFYSAIENEGFQISHSKELTICQRPELGGTRASKKPRLPTIL